MHAKQRVGVQADKASEAAAALKTLVQHPHTPPGTLHVLIKDALQTSSVPVAREILREAFEACHAEVGETAAIDIAQLGATSAELLRTLIQLHALPVGAKASVAAKEMEHAIGQQSTWAHLNTGDGRDDTEAAGVPLKLTWRLCSRARTELTL